MSNESLRTAGILLVVYPTVVFGGASLLWHWITRRSAYYDHPLRRSMWRAGHAHAGVLLLLSLVAIVLVDHAELADGWKQVVRTTIPAAAAAAADRLLPVHRPTRRRAPHPARQPRLPRRHHVDRRDGHPRCRAVASRLTMSPHRQASPCAANRQRRCP